MIGRGVFEAYACCPSPHKGFPSATIDKMANRGANRSVVQYFPEREGYKCGYCGNEDTSLSQGESVHINLSVDRYFVTR